MKKYKASQNKINVNNEQKDPCTYDVVCFTKNVIVHLFKAAIQQCEQVVFFPSAVFDVKNENVRTNKKVNKQCSETSPY